MEKTLHNVLLLMDSVGCRGSGRGKNEGTFGEYFGMKQEKTEREHGGKTTEFHGLP